MFWSSDPDVLVLGAGLSGLRAATLLHKQGIAVKVLEARDRPGGRTYTIKNNGHTYDMGANWIGPTQDHMYQLVEEFGLKTKRQYHTGKHVLDLQGKLSSYEGNISDLTMFGRPPELEGVINRLDIMAVGVDVDTIASIPNAKEMDHTTYATWIDNNVKNEGAKNLLKWFANVCLASDPSEFSLLFFLMFLRQGGSYEKLANIEGGAQQESIVGGSQQISNRMAATLPSNAVHYHSPVISIEQTRKGVIVTTKDGTKYKSKYVICTIPPVLASRIAYTPPLPALRDQLTQRMPMGCVIKVIIVYKKAWWRMRGLSGEVVSDKQPISLMYDKCSDDNKQASLVGFIGGSNARLWTTKSPEDRKEAVLAQVAGFYPDIPEAQSDVIGYFEHDWIQEEYSRGCYLSIMTPGAMTECGSALRTPVGRIHWAGAETARKWTAYMDGAVESGIRVADEIIKRIREGEAKL